ncbi:MAG: autotransporter domain-containing protein [Chlamydiales bacterium]|nr:autotransporter domain-containing protein [Chlamydiales bacterium]
MLSAALGIIGGYNNQGIQPAYAALVSEDGTLIDVKGDNLLSTYAEIFYVAINRAGVGMIGGRNYTGSQPAYAAFVLPDGTLKELSGGSFPSTTGVIWSVAINRSGAGIIGGADYTGTQPGYAALVSPDGTLKELLGGSFPSTNGEIWSVAINRSGVGIIGGSDYTGSKPAYAAFVSPDGTLKELSGGNFPSTTGEIWSVAINGSGTGIIGGYDGTGSQPGYAALVSPDGMIKDLSGGSFPSATGTILSVAINRSGAGIIGGVNSTGSQPGYAALVSTEGTLKDLSGGNFPSTTGTILSVAINRSGAGIIGGYDGTGSQPVAYAALVSPDGTLTDLKKGNTSLDGSIVYSVAINDAGVGIIGGGNFGGGSPAIAALVAPNGKLTNLTGGLFPSIEGSIEGVAIHNDEIFGSIVPKIYGPGSSVMNALFPLTTQVLPNHAMYYHKSRSNRDKEPVRELSLLADATDTIRRNTPCLEAPTSSLWLQGFGTYARQKKEHDFVALTNWIGGGMLGFDYYGIQDVALGVGGAYAYNHVHYSKDKGHARFHQEFLTFYGSWSPKYFFINVAIWGGLYQLKNERNSLRGRITSKAHINGQLLVPHLEVSTPFPSRDNWFVIEPFLMVDWANNWQGKVREHGASGLNLKIGRTYTSMLRSEGGFRFFQSIHYKWGDLIFEEKASYINKLPFHTNKQSAAFVASASSFDIELFSHKTQNLGAAQLGCQFVPCSKKYPYGGLNYQGEFGSSFQSHLVSIEIGKYF